MFTTRRDGTPRLNIPPSAVWRSTLVTVLFAGTGLASRAWMQWPDVPSLARANPTSTALFEREVGLGAWERVSRPWVRLADVSPHLMRAVLVAEDIDFYSHGGFAWAELRLAAGETMRGEAPLRGASTITQQLAKNLWLSPRRSVWRKVKEAALTVELEYSLSKRRILELYLNVVTFGPGVFGAEAAARRYFDKPALFLTEHEGAMLAAGLSRPSIWNPESESETYSGRVDLIERRMTIAEFLWRHVLQ